MIKYIKRELAARKRRKEYKQIMLGFKWAIESHERYDVELELLELFVQQSADFDSSLSLFDSGVTKAIRCIREKEKKKCL